MLSIGDLGVQYNIKRSSSAIGIAMALSHQDYLYAVIEEQHRNGRLPVVKFGMTRSGLAQRMRHYPRNSIMLCACAVDPAFTESAERTLLARAQTLFTQCLSAGREYFECDPSNACDLVHDISKRFAPDWTLETRDSDDDGNGSTVSEVFDSKAGNGEPSSLKHFYIFGKGGDLGRKLEKMVDEHTLYKVRDGESHGRSLMLHPRGSSIASCLADRRWRAWLCHHHQLQEHRAAPRREAAGGPRVRAGA